MRTTDVLVIGAGQAGLATSHCLSQRGIDHLVLDRGRVAERWRSERWDSLRLLTPNWQSRLPGYRYQGDDPDGYMSMEQVVRFFERYATLGHVPVEEHTRVLRVDEHEMGYRVRTDRGDFLSGQVVLATGHCDVPWRPFCAASLDPSIHQLAPTQYRRPAALPPGGVLVVGASASGAQLADELLRSGRDVVLAVGQHTRLPRRYRGADISWWLERLGKLDEHIDGVRNPDAARWEPSLQLMGSKERRNLDLSTLSKLGVRLCGRLTGALGDRVFFADDLEHHVRSADLRMNRLLDRVDALCAVDAGRSRIERGKRPSRITLGEQLVVPSSLSLSAEGIRTVIWATGFRRDYRWLNVPVLDARGEIIQREGVTEREGLYTMGLRFQRTRKSSFIDGVAADAEHVVRHIARRMGIRDSAVA